MIYFVNFVLDLWYCSHIMLFLWTITLINFTSKNILTSKHVALIADTSPELARDLMRVIDRLMFTIKLNSNRIKTLEEKLFNLEGKTVVQFQLKLCITYFYMCDIKILILYHNLYFVMHLKNYLGCSWQIACDMNYMQNCDS